MGEIKSFSSQRFFSCLFSSFYVLLIPGIGLADSSSTSNEQKAASKKSSGLSGLEIFILLLGLLAAVAFTVYLYKLWQRKKREEQHARLLKLFEQDDELEVELGIRD